MANALIPQEKRGGTGLARDLGDLQPFRMWLEPLQPVENLGTERLIRLIRCRLFYRIAGAPLKLKIPPLDGLPFKATFDLRRVSVEQH